MKRRLLFLFALALVAFMFVQNVSAQVSVTATAGTPGPTPYTTLKAAFDAINAGTHQGSITIAISANTNEVTTPCVLNSTGAGSAVYTAVSIYPTADAVTISGATVTGRGLIELNGADNVTIDGDNPNTGGINRNLTIQNTAANTIAYNMAIRIAVAATVVTSANNITIKNCIILGSATGRNAAGITSTTGSENTTYGIYAGGGASTTSQTTPPTAISSVSTVVGAGATMNNLIISNNSINACARGIAVQGSAVSVINLLTVTNNLIGASTSLNTTTVYSMGMTLQGFTAALVAGNTVQNIECFLATGLRAIDLGSINAAGTAAVVEKNYINGVFNRSTSTYGAYGINVAAGAGQTVRNNMIQGITGDMTGGAAFSTTFAPIGIRIAAGTNILVYHNSVNLYGLRAGTATSSLMSTCFAITATTITGCNVRNNIFANTMSGGTTSLAYVSIWLPSAATSAMNLTLNNNAYYSGTTAASQGIAQVGSTAGTGFYLASNFNPGSITPATNLRAYTSTLIAGGLNDNASYASTNAAPYLSAINLHLDLSSPQLIYVEQKGDPTVGITTDIDNDARPNVGTTIPDMGADEVANLNCAAADGGSIAPNIANSCIGLTYYMTATGATTGTGITYQWEVSATGGGLGFGNVTGGSGAATTSYTTDVLAVGTYYYRLKVTCSFGPLVGYSNELTLSVYTLPTVSIDPTSATYCTPAGPPVTLTASGDAGTYAWSPATGLDATTGAVVHASPAAFTTYNVTVTDGNGCKASASTAISIGSSVTMNSVTPNPASVCSGGGISLTASASLPAPSAYCTASAVNSTAFETISNVTLNTINNSSTATAGYENFTAISTNLVCGTGYPVSIGNSEPFSSDLIKIWIDINKDGVFADPDEVVFSGSGAITPATGTITIPGTATNGSTRLRVRLWDNTYSPNSTPCGTSSYGQVEDYTVVISGGHDALSYAWSELPASGTLTNTAINPTTATGITLNETYSVTATSASGCKATGNVLVPVNPLPATGLTVGYTNIACPNAGSNVTVELSVVGTSYQLRKDVDNSPVGPPVPGNGDVINLPTGTLTATTTFNVLATIVSTGCTAQLTSKVTVVVGGPVTTVEQISVCVGTPTIDLPIRVSSFTNVGSISLYLGYDHTKISSPAVVYTNPALWPSNPPYADGFVVNTTDFTDLIRVSGFGTGVTLGDDDILFTLRFTLEPGTTSAALSFIENSLGTYCEYALDLPPLYPPFCDTPTASYYIPGGVLVHPAPTLSGAYQEATVCSGSTATIQLTGLLANSTSTIDYNIDGVSQTPVSSVVADAFGNASFTCAALDFANNGKFLQITGITVNSAVPNCSGEFAINALLSVNPNPTLTGASQMATVCPGFGASIALSGLLPNTIFTVDYSINGVPQAPIAGVGSDNDGNSIFTSAPLALSNDGQILQITGITVTSATPNCSGAFAIDVTMSVNPAGQVNAIANQELCNGSYTTKVDFSTGNPNGITTFTWTNNHPEIGLPLSGSGDFIDPFMAINPSAFPIVATITVTPTFTGNYVGCEGNPTVFTITVNPTPILVITNQATCAPKRVNLTAPAVTAGSFLPPTTVLTYWYDAGCITSQIANPASVGAGTYYIKATCYGCFVTAPVTVTVNHLPTIFMGTGSGSYCAGGPGLEVGLSGSEVGVIYSLWMGFTNLTPIPVNGNGGPITFGFQTLPGEYWVLAEYTGTHCTNRMYNCIYITIVEPLKVTVTIVPSFNPVPVGRSVTFAATPVNGGSAPTYQWIVNNSYVGTNSAIFTYKPADNDKVTCVLTSSLPCVKGPAASNIVTLYIDKRKTAEATGKDDLTGVSPKAAFKLYPNPTTSNFTLEQTTGSIRDNVKVEIYGMCGEKVLSGQLKGEKKHEFSISALPAGLYFVKIVTGDEAETIKLIKTR